MPKNPQKYVSRYQTFAYRKEVQQKQAVQEVDIITRLLCNVCCCTVHSRYLLYVLQKYRMFQALVWYLCGTCVVHVWYKCGTCVVLAWYMCYMCSSTWVVVVFNVLSMIM